MLLRTVVSMTPSKPTTLLNTTWHCIWNYQVAEWKRETNISICNIQRFIRLDKAEGTNYSMIMSSVFDLLSLCVTGHVYLSKELSFCFRNLLSMMNNKVFFFNLALLIVVSWINYIINKHNAELRGTAPGENIPKSMFLWAKIWHLAH